MLLLRWKRLRKRVRRFRKWQQLLRSDHLVAAPELHRAGIAATVGKGVRNQAVIDACVETGSVYFVATGGAAALLAQRVESGEVVAYDDLGTEALRRIVVRDLPVFVGVDVKGRCIYDLE